MNSTCIQEVIQITMIWILSTQTYISFLHGQNDDTIRGERRVVASSTVNARDKSDNIFMPRVVRRSLRLINHRRGMGYCYDTHFTRDVVYITSEQMRRELDKWARRWSRINVEVITLQTVGVVMKNSTKNPPINGDKH